jgi:hypothetical protein
MKVKTKQNNVAESKQSEIVLVIIQYFVSFQSKQNIASKTSTNRNRIMSDFSHKKSVVSLKAG